MRMSSDKDSSYLPSGLSSLLRMRPPSMVAFAYLMAHTAAGSISPQSACGDPPFSFAPPPLAAHKKAPEQLALGLSLYGLCSNAYAENISMVSPSFSVTMAFFQARVSPF